MKLHIKIAMSLMASLVVSAPHAWAKGLARSAASMPSNASQEPMTLSEIQRDLRIQHARELLGKHYNKSTVRTGENIKKINSHIYAWTKERLPKKFRKKSGKVAQTIIDESVKYGFDPVFVLSVIQNESTFNPERKGELDEIGLMQLRPATAEWIAKKFDLKYEGKKTLRDPIANIRIGAAYMNYLREQFDSHAQLYLAAYNMGKRNVDRALEQNIWPKDYASHVMHYYIDFYSEVMQVQQKKNAKTKLALL